MATLQDVLQGMAAYLNQDPALPTGTDLTSWTNLVNQSQMEWANTYHWKLLRKTITPSFSVSGASIALPAYFQKTMSPLADYSTSTPTVYQQLYNNAERFYHSSTDKYFTVNGDDGTGHYMLVNPVLASGASLVIDIQVQPTSLATLSDVITCPAVQYLTLRSISKVLSARSDPRFPQVKADSDDIMSSMIEEDVAASGGVTNRTPDQFTKANFRIGLS